jgi:hypothetical protein
MDWVKYYGLRVECYGLKEMCLGVRLTVDEFMTNLHCQLDWIKKHPGHL